MKIFHLAAAVILTTYPIGCAFGSDAGKAGEEISRLISANYSGNPESLAVNLDYCTFNFEVVHKESCSLFGKIQSRAIHLNLKEVDRIERYEGGERSSVTFVFSRELKDVVRRYLDAHDDSGEIEQKQLLRELRKIGYRDDITMCSGELGSGIYRARGITLFVANKAAVDLESKLNGYLQDYCSQ